MPILFLKELGTLFKKRDYFMQNSSLNIYKLFAAYAGADPDGNFRRTSVLGGGTFSFSLIFVSFFLLFFPLFEILDIVGGRLYSSFPSFVDPLLAHR